MEIHIKPCLDKLCSRLAACNVCTHTPVYAPALPHMAKPIFQLGKRARIVIASQAPGNLAHQKGAPFYDPSGKRLRAWLGVDAQTFYNTDNFAIVPMGFCFPGYDKNGGDLPPRKECAPLWREEVFAHLPNVKLILAIGQYAQRYHLAPTQRRLSLTENVRNWAQILDNQSSLSPGILPLPHPSWRNNAWLAKNTWFEAELLPELQKLVQLYMK